MKLSEALVLSVDTETTGSDPTTDRIVELGGAYLRGRERIGPPLRALVHPGIYIPAGATNVHGIRNEDIEKAPPWPVVAARFKQHLDLDPVVTGYNVMGFDLPLINAENRRHGVPWVMPRVLDTFLFAWWGHRELRSRKLGVICEHYGIGLPADQAHTADADSLACGWLLAGMVEVGLVPDDVERAFARQQELSDVHHAELARYGRYLYPDRQTGDLRLGLGKHTGIALEEAEEEYLVWLLGRPDLPEDAKFAINRTLGRVEQQSLF